MRALSEEITTLKVLVTGASGFLGSHVCKALIKKGYETYAFVRNSSNLFRLKDQPLKFRFGSLGDLDSIEEAVKGMDYVVHCAGLIMANSRDEFFKGNLGGTRDFLKSILKLNPSIKRFIYVSSQAAGSSSNGNEPVNEKTIPKPLTNYGESKLAGEIETLKYRSKIPLSVIRPPGIYGPSDKPTLNFFRFAKYGFIPVFGNEETYISLCHVYDVTNAIVLALENDRANGEVFYVSDGEIYQWVEMWKIMCKSAGKKGRVFKIPKGLFFFGSNVIEKISKLIGKPAMLDYHKATDLTKSWALECTKIKNLLGYEPMYNLEAGARQTFEWYKREKWL